MVDFRLANTIFKIAYQQSQDLFPIALRSCLLYHFWFLHTALKRAGLPIKRESLMVIIALTTKSLHTIDLFSFQLSMKHFQKLVTVESMLRHNSPKTQPHFYWQALLNQTEINYAVIISCLFHPCKFIDWEIQDTTQQKTVEGFTILSYNALIQSRPT